MKFIEDIKYGHGIEIKFCGLKFSISRNLDEKDLPELLKKWYKKRTGQTLNLENPQTFNEKIQWLKLYDNSPLKTQLADKYAVREWIANKIGDQYLIPLLGVWDSFDEIEGASSVERQKYVFNKIVEILGSDFDFEEKDDARNFFNTLRQNFIDMNYKEFKSSDFTKAEKVIESTLSSKNAQVSNEAKKLLKDGE